VTWLPMVKVAAMGSAEGLSEPSHLYKFGWAQQRLPAALGAALNRSGFLSVVGGWRPVAPSCGTARHVREVGMRGCFKTLMMMAGRAERLGPV
jgi:hypothetical protein